MLRKSPILSDKIFLRNQRTKVQHLVVDWSRKTTTRFHSFDRTHTDYEYEVSRSLCGRTEVYYNSYYYVLEYEIDKEKLCHFCKQQYPAHYANTRTGGN